MRTLRSLRKSIGEKQTRRSLGVASAAVVVAVVTAVLTMSYDGTAGLAIPVALVLGVVMLRWPWLLFAIALAQFSILPDGGHLLGFFVPNSSQFLVPALLLAVVAGAAARHRWGTFRLKVADIFVAAFVVAAFIGILTQPGPRQLKYFVNQVFFAICFYFAARWLALGRERFMLILKIVLGAAAFMLADLALVQLTGVGGLWRGSRGPLHSLSDQATYSAIFPPLFLYTAVTAMGQTAGRSRVFWLTATIMGIVATAGVKERSGIVAALGSLLACGIHPKMTKYVVIGTIALIPIGSLWLSTSLGSYVHSRFTDDKDPMMRRRVYVGKAIDYMQSEDWHPVWGTGFARLEDLSNQMLSETEVVWDRTQLRWRYAADIGRRPIHCAPVTIFGEYGYAGLICLIGIATCVMASLIDMAFRARRKGVAVDTALLVAIGASALGILVNALFHNTDTVYPVTAYFWAGVGIIIGHPDVFIVENEEATEEVDGSAEAGRREASG